MIPEPASESRHDTNSPSSAFEHLQAEAEGDWLHCVFVEPDFFPSLLGARSTVVLGGTGDGKSTLRKELARRARIEDAGPLVVEWQVTFQWLTEGGPEAMFRQAARQMIEQAVIELLRRIGEKPSRYLAAPHWVHGALRDIADAHLSRKQRLLNRLEHECVPEGITALRVILQGGSDERQPDDEEPLEWMTDLVQAVTALGWHGIWLLLDGLEAWRAIDQALLRRAMESLLSALGLFDVPGLSLKLFVPDQLEEVVKQSGGLERRRLDAHRIEWDSQQLRGLVEKRLALITGQETFGLESLCAASDWPAWIEKYGGTSPRGWLELTRPLVDHYRQQTGQGPIAADVWKNLVASHPPHLRIDLERQEVYMGYHRIDVSETIYRLLRYLYTHPQRRCTREELYYQGHYGLSTIPIRGQEQWEEEAMWRSWMDTNVGRVRKVIEPDPRAPIYLVSEPSKKLALHNAW